MHARLEALAETLVARRRLSVRVPTSDPDATIEPLAWEIDEATNGEITVARLVDGNGYVEIELRVDG